MTTDFDTLSRIVLALTCFGSAAAAGALGWATHPKYTPHMILVAFWSLWAGAAMFALALDHLDIPVVSDRFVVINLNGAFIVAMGGWALFGLRVWRAAVFDEREQFARTIHHKRRAGDL